MKKLLLFLLTLHVIKVKCQSYPDSLRKYSYYIFGYKTDSSKLQTASGSGYFVRNDNKIFFLTANHVLTGCVPKDTCKLSEKPNSYPSEMTIFLTSSNGLLNFKTIAISIGYLQVILPCTDAGLSPDIAAYELRNKPVDTIYSIEKFLNHSLPKNKGFLCVYGFPSYANYTPEGQMLANSTLISLNKYDFIEFYQYKACGGGRNIDSISYLIRAKDSIRNDLQGFSGSPSFIQNVVNKKWYFIGTLVGCVEKDKLAFVKPKFTKEAIGIRN